MIQYLLQRVIRARRAIARFYRDPFLGFSMTIIVALALSLLVATLLTLLGIIK